MSKLSLRLLTKLVLHLNFLLLLHGTGESASPAPNPAPNPEPSPALLGADEVKNLIAVTDKLGLKPAPLITNTFCDDKAGSTYGDTFGCSYKGKACYITKIYMSSLGLSSEIPEEMGSLRFLRFLILSSNKLHGTIPDTLGNLFFLRILDLSNNQLTGSIPESLGNLVFLQSLSLQNNMLDGCIPPSLGSLTNLLELNLQFNMLSLVIPNELGKLTKLKTLNLYENQLSGPLPEALGNLLLLETFWVSANRLTGKFPESYVKLTNLTRFSIAGNYISDKLPVKIVKLWKNLVVLSLVGNNFEGNLTEEVFDLPYLQYLLVSDLANASFQFPQKLQNTKYFTLIMRNCSINGTIPTYIGQMPSLKYLDLSFNNLIGTIPESMASVLTDVSFSNNMLNGTIPNWIFHADRTRRDLSFNKFSAIDSEGPSNENLNLFACCRNSSDTAPEMRDPFEMMNAYCPEKKPKYHSLFINCGGGETTVDGKTYDQDNSTSRFYTSPKKNWAYSFSGDFGSKFSNSSDFTKNMTCGVSVAEAPLYDKARLSPVSLKYYAFCLHKGNYTVTLRFAEIVYTEDAPDYAGSRTRAFDIHIQGIRRLSNFNIKEKAGGSDKPITRNFTALVNENVLEIHLYWAGKGSFDNQPAYNGPLISAISVIPDFKVDDEKLGPLYVVLIAISSFIIALLLLVALAWSMGWLGSGMWRKINIGQGKSVTLRELIAATGNFSRKQKIGSGGFGIVYKAELQGQTVAVKKLSPRFKERIKELKSEIFTMTSLKHNNLIKLLDFHIEKGLKVLVYEYMQNKSLADALFDSNSKVKLTWDTRCDICLGIAKGLLFLHDHPRLKMVHMNIKAVNILLDEHLEAKISDFGLARLHSEEDQVMVMKREVTQGYMAPEYFLGKATREADVYSFGVVVLEIVSGKKNVVTISNQEIELLVDRAHKYDKEGKLSDLVDKNLEDCDTRQALTILNLAVKCTNVAPSVRPTMSEVVKNINEVYRPASTDKAPSATSMDLGSTSSPSIKGSKDDEFGNTFA